MENRKRQYSRMVIEDVFLKLLHEKPLEKITVVELCKLANVNRSTFYSNYLDIYDLMDQVIDNFLKTLFHQSIAGLGEHDPHGVDDSLEMIQRALYTTLEQRELCRLLIVSSGRLDFTKRLMNTLLEWSQKRYIVFTGEESDIFNLEYTMMLGGVLALWQKWIENDFQESPELLSDIINTYIKINADCIWER